jgi:GNAT superfamily N-acetyltransferase
LPRARRRPGSARLRDQPSLAAGEAAAPLDEFIGALPPQSDCWLIHDLALRPGVRGAGFAARIVEELAAVARAEEFSVMALVALGGAAPFWRRAGFADAGSTVPKDKLRSYGEDAVYMERAV